MGSGGPANTTQTTTQSLPGWAQGTAKSLLGAGSNLYLPNGQPAAIPSNLTQQVASFTPAQQQAMSLTQGQTGAASNLGNVGANQLNAQLSGAYLNPTSDPYLQGTYNESAQSLINSYQTATAPSLASEGIQASGGGPGSLAGNSAFQQSQALNQYGLGQNLSGLATNIFGGAYQQGVQNQLTAQGLVPSAQSSLYQPAQQLLGTGTLQQQQQQNVLNTAYQNALAAAQYPQQSLTGLGNLLGQATGGSGQSVTVGTNPQATK